jgi:hypothetical protein
MVGDSKNAGLPNDNIEGRLMQTESLEQILQRRNRAPWDSPPAWQGKATWVENASLFWDFRYTFARIVAIVFVLSILLALSLPKEYVSGARIMPPEQGGNSAAMLAALVGKNSAGGLAGLAGSLLGAKNNGALFVALLHSGTVSGHLIDRFDLQHVTCFHSTTATDMSDSRLQFRMTRIECYRPLCTPRRRTSKGLDISQPLGWHSHAAVYGNADSQTGPTRGGARKSRLRANYLLGVRLLI